MEPLAARTAPERTAAQHQSLLHFVGRGGWSDEKVLAKVRETVLPALERHGPIEAWIIDDTGFPKKGTHSVGVSRHYCGQLGKQDNCQVAVSLSLANAYGSLPVAYRLYLPQVWSSDAAAPQAGRRSRRHHVQDQAGDHARPDPGRRRGRSAARGCADGRRLRSGRRAMSPCRPCLIRRGAGGRPNGCAATKGINRSPSRLWRSTFPPGLGGRSAGGRERMRRSKSRFARLRIRISTCSARACRSAAQRRRPAQRTPAAGAR